MEYANLQTITSTNASRDFSHVLNQVRYQGAAFLVTKNNQAYARIVPDHALLGTPISELASIWSALPRLDVQDAKDFAADVAAVRRKANRAERKAVSAWDAT